MELTLHEKIVDMQSAIDDAFSKMLDATAKSSAYTVDREFMSNVVRSRTIILLNGPRAISLLKLAHHISTCLYAANHGGIELGGYAKLVLIDVEHALNSRIKEITNQ